MEYANTTSIDKYFAPSGFPGRQYAACESIYVIKGLALNFVADLNQLTWRCLPVLPVSSIHGSNSTVT